MKRNGWTRFSQADAHRLKDRAGGVHGTFAKSLLTCVPGRPILPLSHQRRALSRLA